MPVATTVNTVLLPAVMVADAGCTVITGSTEIVKTAAMLVTLPSVLLTTTV